MIGFDFDIENEIIFNQVFSKRNCCFKCIKNIWSLNLILFFKMVS